MINNGDSARDRSDKVSHLAPPSGTLWRRILPVAGSLGLVGWLICRVPLSRVLQATYQVEWRLLAPLTMGLVTALYFWDAVCVRWIFAQAAGAVSYWTAVRARGSSYLLGAINYGLGQGLMAWIMARSLCISLAAALGRLLIIAYHDLWLLLAMGLVGSMGTNDPRWHATRLFCVAGLATLAALTVVVRLIPSTWRQRIEGTRWSLSLSCWSWDRSLYLLAMRLTNFAISTAYAGAGLYFSHVPWNGHELFRAISLIQLTEALPITVSGLGTREAILLGVLNPERPEHCLAFGLVWSTGLIVGRLAIGLAHLGIWGHSVWSIGYEDVLATSEASARMELASPVGGRSCGRG
jgi:hypothetical protein